MRLYYNSFSIFSWYPKCSFNLPDYSNIIYITNNNLYFAFQPDYNGQSISWSTQQKTITDYGWIICKAAAPNGVYDGRIIIKRNNKTIEIGHGELSSGNYSNTQNWVMPVIPGDIIYSSNSQCNITFYPMNVISEDLQLNKYIKF